MYYNRDNEVSVFILPIDRRARVWYTTVALHIRYLVARGNYRKESMATVIAIGNHKGGVGKTTTAHCLSAALADRHRKVLAVDMDAQSSLSNACGFKPNQTEDANMGDTLWMPKGNLKSIEQVIVRVSDHFDLAPANLSMSDVELGIGSQAIGREGLLRKALRPVLGKYDYIIIDSAPALGMLTINAIMASQWVIIPTQPQIIDIRGLALFRKTLARLREEGAAFQEMGILLTFYAGYNLHKEAEGAMSEMGLRVFKTKIGRSVKAAEAPQYGESVITYAPDNPRTQEYRNFAQEVLECLK